MVSPLIRDGWQRFPADPKVLNWVQQVLPVARACANDPAEQAKWLQCQGTWFVGVDSLPNDASGAVSGGGALAGDAYDLARELYGELPLHRAQVSVMYPGYPRPRQGEGQGAFRYRLNRDAAHVDGLLAVGPDRQRMLKERHAYILGLPLTASDETASPMVIWQGSHHIMRRAFETVLQDHPPETWENIDLTQIYKEARNKVFTTCPRLTLPAQPGEAYLVHRHALHGVAPWQTGAAASPDGRMIAYFRPEIPGDPAQWLTL